MTFKRADPVFVGANNVPGVVLAVKGETIEVDTIVKGEYQATEVSSESLVAMPAMEGLFYLASLAKQQERTAQLEHLLRLRAEKRQPLRGKSPD